MPSVCTEQAPPKPRLEFARLATDGTRYIPGGGLTCRGRWYTLDNPIFWRPVVRTILDRTCRRPLLLIRRKIAVRAADEIGRLQRADIAASLSFARFGHCIAAAQSRANSPLRDINREIMPTGCSVAARHELRHLRNQRDRGFTMVELMITLVLLAVLAGIAAPAMSQFIRASRLNSAANQFHADLQMARREAIRRNTHVLVCPLEAEGSTSGKCGANFTKWATWGWLVCYDTNPVDGVCDDDAAADPNPIRTHGPIDPSITLTGLTAVVGFNPNGTAGEAAQFTIATTWTPPKTYTGSVDPSGNIALVKPPA